MAAHLRSTPVSPVITAIQTTLDEHLAQEVLVRFERVRVGHDCKRLAYATEIAVRAAVREMMEVL